MEQNAVAVAVHELSRWKLAVIARRKRIAEQAKLFDVAEMPTICATVEQIGQSVVQITPGDVLVGFGGNLLPIEKLPTTWTFHPAELALIRDAVLTALDREERRLYSRISQLPAAVEPFKTEIAEEELEKKAREAAATAGGRR